MKIAIAGFGLEGRTNYDYWNTPDNQLTIVDAREQLDDLPEGVPTLLGADAFSELSGFDLVIRTAGLAPSKIKTDGKVWSATNEFFVKCPAPIIGVTGTKGKGTTVSMISSMLSATGKTVHVVGNIGVPALSELPKISAEDIVVFEMSSFQLWDIERSPQLAVVLMIEPDHLNVHSGFDDYVVAKANIRLHQKPGDYCLYHPTNQFSRQIGLMNVEDGHSSSGRYGVPDDGHVYVSKGTFWVGDQPIFSIDAVQLPGAHNLENACAAISAALRFTDDVVSVEQGLRSFEGLPHRLEFVRELDGVRYYNDSFSSAPGATAAAVRAYTEPEIVVLGGIDKGADFTDMAEAIKSSPNIKQLIIIGEIRHKLADFLVSQGVDSPIDVSEAHTMPEIVRLAKNYASSGDVVILSPGCASFDMFKDFYDRGTQFREVVLGL